MKAPLALILALFALPLCAQTEAPTEAIVAGLSQSSVSITADFSGAEIMVYGAVKRESAIPEGDPLRIVVTVQGPSAPLKVRRDETATTVLGPSNRTDSISASANAVFSTTPI